MSQPYKPATGRSATPAIMVAPLFSGARPVSDHGPDRSYSLPTLLDPLQRSATQRVFVHDYAATDVPTLRRILGVKASLYPERALLVAQRGDLVLVTQPVDPAFVAYLDELDVGPGDDGVLAASVVASTEAQPTLLHLACTDATTERVADRIHRSHELRLNPYFCAAAARAFQRRLEKRLGREVVLEGGPPEVADLANRKDIVRGVAADLGIPTAPGEVVRWADTEPVSARAAAIADAVARHRVLTGKAIVRGAWAMRGSDNVTQNGDEDPNDLREWLMQRPHLTSYLVESFVRVDASPNVQVWIDDDAHVRVLHVTDQRMDGKGVHVGNAYPHATALASELRASSTTLARWLARMGYRGPVGFDFMETVAESGAATHLLAEVNARINGSTYPLVLSERLNQVRCAQRRSPIEAWVSNTLLRVPPCGFAELRDLLGDRLYTHSAGRGVVPYNTGLLAHGSMHAVILGASIAEAKELECELKSRLATSADR